VTIINTSEFTQSFTYGGASNISIVSVTQGGRNITSQFSTLPVQFNDRGTYTITLMVAASDIRDAFLVEARRVIISSVFPSNDLVEASRGFGTTFIGSANIRFNPQRVLDDSDNEDVILTITKDDVIERQFRITANGVTRIDDKIQSSDDDLFFGLTDDEQNPRIIPVSISGNGVWEVTLTTTDNSLMFIDGFTIGVENDPIFIILVVIIAVAILVGVIIFVKLRTGLRVR